jgi:hypothetical protein
MQEHESTSQGPFSDPSRGVNYPTNYLLAMVETELYQQEAYRALLEAGFADENIVLLNGDETMNFFRAEHSGFHPWHKLKAALASVMSDEGTDYIAYREAAQKGDYLLAVCIEDPSEVNKAGNILKAHHGFMIRFFGRWDVTDIE